MVYFFAILALLATGAAVALGRLWFKALNVLLAYEQESERRLDKLRMRLHEQKFKTRRAAVANEKLIDDLAALKQEHGHLKASVRASLAKLTGRGFRGKHGGLEHSKAFKQLSEVVEQG